MHMVQKNDNGDIAALMITSLNSVFRETMDGDDDDDDGRNNKHARTETPARVEIRITNSRWLFKASHRYVIVHWP